MSRVAIPSSTSPDPRVQAPPGERYTRGVEGGIGGRHLIWFVGFVIALHIVAPWLLGVMSRIAMWWDGYAAWAYKIASGQ